MTDETKRNPLKEIRERNAADPDRPGLMDLYQQITGKKPHHMWTSASLREKIAEAQRPKAPAPAERRETPPEPAEATVQVADEEPSRPRRRQPPRERRMSGPVTIGDTRVAWAENLDPDYVYRWVKDDESGHRMKQLYDRDWDPVDLEKGEEKAASFDGTSQPTCVANPGTTGGRLKLVKKWKPWYEEDQQRKSVLVDASEEAIKSRTHAEGRVSGKDYYEPGNAPHRNVIEHVHS